MIRIKRIVINDLWVEEVKCLFHNVTFLLEHRGNEGDRIVIGLQCCVCGKVAAEWGISAPS